MGIWITPFCPRQACYDHQSTLCVNVVIIITRAKMERDLYFSHKFSSDCVSLYICTYLLLEFDELTSVCCLQAKFFYTGILWQEQQVTQKLDKCHEAWQRIIVIPTIFFNKNATHEKWVLQTKWENVTQVRGFNCIEPTAFQWLIL